MVVTQGGCPGKLQGMGYAFLDVGWSSFLMCIYYFMTLRDGTMGKTQQKA